MLTTPELIIALERRGVLPPGDVARVRQLYENSPTEFMPRVMIKWLVSRGRITADQGNTLLNAAPELTAHEVLDRVLGINDDLELAGDEDGALDEDTKEMPAGDEAEPLSLPPPGTAAFVGTPEGKQPLMPTPKPPAPPTPATPAVAPMYADLFDELLEGSAGPALSPLSPASRKNLRPRGWDTPLILVGGGTLAALLLVGAFLLWRIVRQGGDDAFTVAEESYGNGGYATALERYDRFLTEYPTHRAISTAKLHRGLARLRLAVESGTDSARALAVAEEELPTMAAQTEFPTAKPDLAVLLPDLAENLAKQAAASNDATVLEQARQARRLIDKFLGDGEAMTARLRPIDALLATAEHQAAREVALERAVADIREAATSRDLPRAVQARSQLLAAFPEAAKSAPLGEAMAALADMKREAVKFAADQRPAETVDVPSPALRRVTLVERRGTAVAGVDGISFALMEGTLFALHAADGRVAWTRPLGFDARLPERIESTDGAEALVYDPRERALIWLGVQDGKLRRRQPIDDVLNFSLGGGRAYVVCRERIVVVDVATGRNLGQITFPQALRTATTADRRGGVRYVAAEADDLYVLATNDFRCLQTVFLGHARGAVAVPPIFVDPYLLVIENVGEQARLRLFETGADGAGLKELDARMIAGRVSLTPQTSQRFVAVVTDRGGVQVLDLSGAKDRRALDPIAQLTGTDDGDVLRHFLFQGLQFWLGGNNLTRYELQPSLGKLTPVRTIVQSRATLQPPERAGSLIIAAMQPTNRALPRSVAAFEADGGSLQWEAYLPQELSGPPRTAGNTSGLTCVTRLGTVFDVDDRLDTLPATTLDVPAAQFEANLRPDTTYPAATLPDGGLVFLSDYFALGSTAGKDSLPLRELLVVEPRGTEPRTRRTRLAFHPGGGPATFRDGVLLPFENGQIHWLDPRSGEQKAEPFQLPMTAGRKAAWSRIGVAGDELFITDGTDRLHHLGLDAGPPPQLVRRDQGAVAVRTLGRKLAAVGKTLYAVDADHELLACSIPDLRWGDSWPLSSSATNWEPAVVGSTAFALERRLNETTLLALTDDGRLKWRAQLARPCFTPTADGNEILLADDHGDVLRLDAATGKLLGRIDLQVPLACEPVIVGERLVVTTQAGELWWIAKP
jgi:outer membrane protein assembly factor BamB